MEPGGTSKAMVFKAGELSWRVPCYLLLFAACLTSVWGFNAEWDAEGLKYIADRRRLSADKIETRAEISEALDRYMAEGMSDVIGWFDMQCLLVLRVLSAYQLSEEIYGGVAEIGVHHGKSFVGLGLLNMDAGSSKGIALAVDVFDAQHLNTDASGEGDLQIFMSTLEAWCGSECVKAENLKVLSQDSKDLTPEDVVDAMGETKPRIFSVDGSHTAEATYVDMKTATQAVNKGGIVIVDDYFSEGWPGVSEGVIKFFYEQSETEDRFVPFFIGFNKVMFASEEFASIYMDTLHSQQAVIGDGTLQVKIQLMLGHPVVVMAEEVRCKKHTRTLLPGEACPAGMQCS